MFITVDTKSI